MDKIYPEGIHEFHTGDRTAETGPPALLRVRIDDKREMSRIIQTLVTALADGDDSACLCLSGKLNEVED